MGLFNRKKKEKESKEAEDYNPYTGTSMPQREKKFDAFKDYAAQKNKFVFKPRGADEPVEENYNDQFNNNPEGPRGPGGPSRKVGGGPYSAAQQGPEYEETYQEYKARMAREKEQKDKLDKIRNGTYRNNSMGYDNAGGMPVSTYDEDDLNAPAGNYNQYDADDLNAPSQPNGYGEEHGYEQQQQQIQEETEEERAQREEEEEIEDIKGELSFTRDKSLASTQRTLQMARNAEISGQNSLGLLGSQSERLYDTESNIRLAQTQNRIGTERAKELRTAGNVFRAPQNPFNKKHRLRMKEEKLRADLVHDRTVQDQQRKQFQESERRVKENLYTSTKYGTAQEQKTREAALHQHKQYLYDDEDSEEEEKELQIGHNLKEIHGYSQRLHKLALAQSDEIEKQNSRLNYLAENMDELNIGVEQNKERLRMIVHK